MIGLVNAAGASETARAESVSRSVRGRVAEQRADLAPLLNSEAAAYRVLTTAIKAMDEAFEPPPTRGTPSGEESDRFAQAELEAGTSAPTLGSHVDVTA